MPIVQRRAADRPDRNGLPSRLKAGVETLSGLSMDPVRVHYRSAEPAKLGAHAFTRGTDIHLAPGQERHLPHEAWHVVQQSQGRVKPTLQVAGAQVNDDAGLEREADRMGAASAAQLNASPVPAAVGPALPATVQQRACVQRVIKIEDGSLAGRYDTPGGKDTNDLIDKIDTAMGKKLKRGWKTGIKKLVKADKKKKFPTSKDFRAFLLKHYEKSTVLDDLKKKKKIRPNFPPSSYKIGAMGYGLQTGNDESEMKPSEENLALPHRFPYAAIQSSTEAFINGSETATDLDRWTERLLVGTKERFGLNLPELDKGDKPYYKKTVEAQIETFEEARTNLKKAVANGDKLDLYSPVVQAFLKIVNAVHGNVPDYGPHAGVNIQVSDRLHLHALSDGSLTPGSKAAASMTPGRVPKGLAYTKARAIWSPPTARR